MGNKYDDFYTKVTPCSGVSVQIPHLWLRTTSYYLFTLSYTVLVTMVCKSDCNWLNADAGLVCLVKAWWTRN